MKIGKEHVAGPGLHAGGAGSFAVIHTMALPFIRVRINATVFVAMS